MKLTKLEIWNYRAFVHAEVEFPPDGVVLVTGVNNAGKTALLSVLDVVAGRAAPANERYHRTTDPLRVTATFRLTDDELSALLPRSSNSPLRVGGAYRRSGAFRETWWDFEVRGEWLVLVRLRAKWNGSDDVVLAQVGYEGGASTFEINEVVDVLKGKREVEPSLRKVLSTSDNTASLRTYAGHSPELQPLFSLLDEWSSGLYHFTALRTGTPEPNHVARAEETLTPSGQNLPAVLNHLYHNHKDRFDLLASLVEEIVPGVGKMWVPFKDDRISVGFRDPEDGDLSLNLKSLGTGVEQLLMTLAVGVSDRPLSMVVMEEPETNLDPGAQRALLALIRSWAVERPFVIATHSSVFIDGGAESEMLLVQREGGKSSVRTLGGDALEALQDLGVRLSDVTSADHILLLEGASDEAILQVWFSDLLRNPRLVIVDGAGGDNARYAGRLQEWLQKADRIGVRKVLYLRDRDELPDAELAKLERGGTVKVGSGREIENYLLDATALAAVLSDRTRNGVTPDEVEKALGEVADALKKTVILKRVCRDIRMEPLMDHRLRGRLGKENAGLSELKTAVSERLKTKEDLGAELDQLWSEAETFVNKDWAGQRLRLAPGEEILGALWRCYGLGGYSKKVDGPAIAAKMHGPADLERILADFLKS